MSNSLTRFCPEIRIPSYFLRKRNFSSSGKAIRTKYISVWLTVKHSLAHAARTLPPPLIATSPVPSSISTTVHATRSVQFLPKPVPFQFQYLLANSFTFILQYIYCCATSIQIDQCYCYVYVNCVTITISTRNPIICFKSEIV